MSNSSYQYRINFGWSTILGVLSFGILVPTFFIPLDLWTSEHLTSVIVATITSYVTWEGCKFIQSIIAYKLPWAKSIVRRLIVEIISIFLFSSGILVIGILIYNAIVASIEINFSTVLRNIFVTFTLALLFTAINEGTFLFSQWKKSLVEQEQLKKVALEAKLENLKKQLDPHFLFNSLSVLSGIIHKDIDLADTFIAKLSQVYRYVLEHNELKTVTVHEELKFVDSYTFLLKVRFQEKIILTVDPTIEYIEGNVIPLSLQLLIENAIKHNHLTTPLQINIYSNDNKIWVENKLQLRENPETSTKKGLENLHERYSLLSNETIEIARNSEYFRVGIPLLKHI